MRAALLLVLLAGCAPSTAERVDNPPPNDPPIRLTSPEQRESHVGKLVTLRGEAYFNDKQPTLIGVDVEIDSADRHAVRAEATGVLRKEVVTQEALDSAFEKGKIFATRGAGTYYFLVDPRTGRLAKARPLP